MKKHLFLKSLLIAIGLLIASCPQLWATWYLKGGFNDWGTGNDITSGVTTVTINSTGDYKFKIHDGDGTWYGCNGTISSTEGDWVFYTDHGDCTLRVSTTGTYTFGWNATSHVVTVIFPGENSKKTLPKQKYIYFDVRSETYWNAAAFTARYWFKNYATGVDIGSGVECSTPLENWVYYAAVPNNDNVGRIQINRIKNSDTDGTTNVVYAWSRGSTSQNCLKEETGKTNYKDSWTPQWTTYCPIKKTSVISDNSTVTYGGNGGSSTPYKVEKGGTINVSASSTDYISDGNMTTKYAFYVGASKNQDGTGTTYSYTASATAGTTHQLKVNSYNYYNSTSSTAKYSDIL